MVCQFHTNKCRSSINVHTFLVPTLFYMYWTFAVFAPTSISSFHHDFAVATMSFNSQLLSFRWSWMRSWLPKKSQFWPWLMAHFTSVTTVARSVMAMCFQPSQSGSRRYHSGLLGRQTSSCANEAITSRCVLVQYLRAKTFRKWYTHTHGILAFGRHYTFFDLAFGQHHTIFLLMPVWVGVSVVCNQESPHWYRFPPTALHVANASFSISFYWNGYISKSCTYRYTLLAYRYIPYNFTT